MTATITASNGAGTTTPHLVLVPYQANLESRNIVHDLSGGGIAVSLVPPRPRSGEFEALYLTEAEAFDALTLHQQPTSFELAESDVPTVGMTYVVDGTVRIRLDDQTQHVWILTIGYQEILP
jgi:hypothetical protein